VANHFHYQATQFFPQPELEVGTAMYPLLQAVCYGVITELKIPGKEKTSKSA
jgi:hypothetical protein